MKMLGTSIFNCKFNIPFNVPIMCIFFLEGERLFLQLCIKKALTHFRSYQLTVRVKMNSPGFSMWGSSGSVMESSVAEIPCEITVNIQSFIL